MLTKFSVVCLVATSLWVTSNATNSKEEKNDDNNALNPKALKALQYTLSFDVKFEKPKNLFAGQTKIWLQCITPTQHIILNAKDIFIDEKLVEVTKQIKSDSPEEDVKYKWLNIDDPKVNKKKEWYIITMKEKLEKGEIVLVSLEYTKILLLTDPDIAFAKYSYTKIVNEEKLLKWVAVTRPGAVNARRLYPCVDEPDSKAKFIVEITHDKNYTTLSNTSKDENFHVSTKEWSSEMYDETYPLSTFSIGFVIGDFKIKRKIDEETRREIRIWADETVLHQMEFASDIALKIYQLYYTYFNNILGAFDLNIAALPNYNYVDKWRYGLITLDESLIAVQDPSNEIKKMEVTFQLCDLFSQQYFGPQTTLSSWSENWVNMGFALFFRIPCFEKMYPGEEASVASKNLVESFMHVLSVEAEIKARPLNLPDENMNLITLFDDTLLCETAYLLVRMMSFFLGQSVLHESVQSYIQQFRFESTNLDKLWTLFPSEIKKDKLLKGGIKLKDVMDSWTSKAGHAYIKLTRDTDSNVVIIKQILPGAKNGEANDARIIPLNFIKKDLLIRRSHQEASATFWLQSEIVKIEVYDDEWIINDSRLNVLCRVEYDSRSLELLQKTLLDVDEYKIITVLTRTNYIIDLFAVAEMGNITYEPVFDTMPYLIHEHSHLPLMVALHEFNKIRFGLLRTDELLIFENYVQKIFQSIFDEKLFSKIEELPQDDYETYNFKQLVTKASCTYGVEGCTKQSNRLFNEWSAKEQLEVNNPIPSVLRQVIYCRVIQENNYETWNFMWELYDKKYPGTFDDILNALACTKDEEKLYKYLMWSIDTEKIALRDGLTVFKSVGFNAKGYPLMIKFFQENLQSIIKVYAKTRSNMYSYLEILYEITYTQDDLNKLDELILEKDVDDELPNLEIRLKDSRWRAAKNIAWLERNRHDLPLFLHKAIESTEELLRRKPQSFNAGPMKGIKTGGGLRRRKKVETVETSEIEEEKPPVH